MVSHYDRRARGVRRAERGIDRGAGIVTMHRRHKYEPNLIGALIGALLCFVLLETIPALI